MINKRLVSEVIKEATKLRGTATKGELRNLVFKNLRPTSVAACVYGQMTGNCANDRAKELLGKCAIPVVHIEEAIDTTNVSCKLKPTGSKSNLLDREERSVFSSRIEYLSAIETYIMQKGADNRKLLSYLRGRTETLDLSHTINC